MRFAELERHIASIGELRNIIGAMRSLAGIRVQEAQRALPGVRRYGQTVADAVAAALSLVAEPLPETSAQGRCGLVLFLAEHGFVGGFNERILAAAEAALRAADVLFVLGSRGAARLAESGRTADWSSPIATRAEGLGETVRQLTGELYRRIAAGDLRRVAVIVARHRQGGAEIIETRQLLPLAPQSPARPRARMPPLHNLQPQALLEELIADHVFALLVEAAVDSQASENAARFAAMEAAHDNISERLDNLRQEARAARQDEITTELLELIGGSKNAA
ncbi:MAG: F0F1 ATP synthase subunit gamma [Thiohalocapsa sp.]